MTPLTQAAESALYKYTAGGTASEEEHFFQGFLAGAKHILSRPEILQVREALENNMFSFDGEDEHNNEDVIDALRALAKLMAEIIPDKA